MKYFLVSILAFILYSGSFAQSCNTISLADSLHACSATTYTLDAAVSGADSVLSISWSPAAGLSATTISDPVLTAGTSGYYAVSVTSLTPDNLVTNGNFSAGNSGFTSSYTYMTSCCTYPGDYEVATDPHTYYSGWPATGDHTSGSGNMLMVDGDESSGVSFWCETITVTPGTNYIFSLWTMLLASPLPSNQILINGTVVSSFTTSTSTSIWTQHSYVWNSGTSTSAEICLRDNNLEEGGNDFAIDDISFQAECVTMDSIYVAVAVPETTHIHTDTSVCILESSITLTAPAGFTTHTWTDGSTGTTDLITAPGTYRVYETGACIAQTDTFHVTSTPLAATEIHTDTTVCATETSITLNAPPGYSTHTWNDGSTGTTDLVPAPGTYRVYETNSSGCTSLTDTFHITSISVTNTYIHTDTIVCANLPIVTLTAPEGYSTYAWSDGTTGSTDIVTVPGTYRVFETGSCSSQTDTFHITTKPVPAVNLGDDTTFCSGNFVTLRSADGPYTDPAYSWSTGSTAATISVGTSGNYILDVTVNGCTGADTVLISVTPTPPAPVLGSNAPLCSGNLLQLTASLTPTYTEPATYSWTGPDGFTSVAENPAINPAATLASGTYFASASYEGCISPTSSETIVVDSTPAPITVTTPVSICEYGTLSLTATTVTPGVSYSWAGPLSYTSLLENPTITDADTTQSGNYIVTATLGICAATATSAVTVNPIPVLIADSSNSPVCQGTTLMLYSVFTDEISGRFNWAGPGGYTSPVQDPVITGVPLTAAGVYSVSETRFGCTSAVYTIPVIINITPGIPAVTTNAPVCLGDTLKLTASDTTAGVTYSWSGPNSFATTLQNPVIPDVTADDGGIYSVTVTLGLCTSFYDTSVNTSYFRPGSNSPVCTGDTLYLYANGAAGSTYIWTGPYAYRAYDSTSASARFITNVTTESAGVYTVTALTTGCATTETDTVVINQTPGPPFVTSLSYCQYYPAPPLMANDSNIIWYPADTVSAGGSSTAPIPPTTDTGSTFYYLVQTVQGCQSAVDYIQVTVRPKPVMSLNITDTSVCPHTMLELTAADTDTMISYRWEPGIYLDDTNTASVTVNPETDLAYTVVTTNQYGCTDTAVATINVYPAALISLGGDQTLYPEQTYTMSPVTNCTYFSWSPATGLSSTSIPDPVAEPVISTVYTLYGKTENGCSATDSIKIYESDYSILALPNAFTPGNGPDNIFMIIKQGAATLHYFRIYNRWGQKVFETTNIDAGWDGTLNGTPQPFGVYVYELEAVTGEGHVFDQKGNVTLLR